MDFKLSQPKKAGEQKISPLPADKWNSSFCCNRLNRSAIALFSARPPPGF